MNSTQRPRSAGKPGPAMVGRLFSLPVLPLAALAVLTSGSPPPPPPPPPVVLASHAVQQMPAIVIANSEGDSILIEADSLQSYAVDHAAIVESASSAFAVSLRDGSNLRIDDRTPPGLYWLADGRRLSLDARLGYPRYYSHSSAPLRTLPFSIRSRGRVGVWIGPDRGEAETFESVSKTYGEEVSRQRFPHATVVGTTAYEYPADWYRRAYVALPSITATPIRIVWLAYGTSPGPSPSVEAKGKRLQQVLPVHPVRVPDPAGPVSLHHGRLVGQLTFDPGTGHLSAPTPARR